ncbi:MAG: iron-sulfur cluster assembly accessory protein [Gammaproteobacteria bacterium]|nr:iron-sulfur cluster assembly accessory protein [Gammaproteobacteria bacterium]MCH9743618.1 iron-sulfur cluster assembly accessory protein [Gammaproteobacteria bacterium]
MTMMTLTDAAIAHIKRVISERGAGIGFRISVKETGCSGYMYVPEIVDQVPENDLQVQAADDLIVFIDPTCKKILEGTVLDYVKKDLGMEQLQFNNPNAEGLCGCGESFKLKSDTDD